MATLFEELSEKIKNKKIKIVFPEGEDDRILSAAVRLNEEQLITPILLGNKKNIQLLAEEKGLLIDNIEIIDPSTYDPEKKSELVTELVAIRKGKTDEQTAEKWLGDVNYFGTMLVQTGHADGMVSGAAHATADTVRPALQIIKTAPGNSRISGAFLMQKDDEKYIFADTAINIEIDAPTMADIAVQSYKTAQLFDIDPKIAMLSFSTKGSARHDLVVKVAEATELAKKQLPELSEKIDGELQFDAAIDQTVAKSKAKDSTIAGNANVFIFPSLEAGNIGYKIAQRLGGYEAIGPILQGLAKPVADLSRGANEEDIYKLAIVTASQVIK